jgi:hypothetical protein
VGLTTAHVEVDHVLRRGGLLELRGAFKGGEGLAGERIAKQADPEKRLAVLAAKSRRVISPERTSLEASSCFMGCACVVGLLIVLLNENELLGVQEGEHKVFHAGETAVLGLEPDCFSRAGLAGEDRHVGGSTLSSGYWALFTVSMSWL